VANCPDAIQDRSGFGATGVRTQTFENLDRLSCQAVSRRAFFQKNQGALAPAGQFCPQPLKPFGRLGFAEAGALLTKPSAGSGKVCDSDAAEGPGANWLFPAFELVLNHLLHGCGPFVFAGIMLLKQFSQFFFREQMRFFLDNTFNWGPVRASKNVAAQARGRNCGGSRYERSQKAPTAPANEDSPG